ncbi:MAG: glycosyltransferase family 2 protein [Candidatus Hydrogenedentes bacterium]|nr:glycosyltransferase family 2 protein [Candidatus Hydrogenedentota bacterium]
MRKVAAIITAYNRADFVPKCLASLIESQHDQLQFVIFVMDNGSSDDTADVAKAAGREVHVIRTEDNRPIAEVINRGLDAAHAAPDIEYILLMNEDTQFTPGSVERLLDACDHHPLSVLTPLQFNYRKPEHLDDNAFKDVIEARELVEDAVVGRPLREVYPIRTIIGAAMVARREVWANVGKYDTTFWFYGVDDDFCNRARWLGYEILLVPGSHLYHMHGKLQASPKRATWPPLEKWRKECQCRYLFRIKVPDTSLPLNYLRTFWFALQTSFACAKLLWPQGTFYAITIYLDCLMRYGSINRIRSQHFDPSRKVTAIPHQELGVVPSRDQA